MDLVQIDPIRPEAAQTVLHLVDDPAAGVALGIRILAHGRVTFGGQHDVIAPATGQGLADDLLGLAGRIHVGGVHEVDARIEGPMDDPGRVLVVRDSERPEHHRTETERTDLHAGTAENAISHAWTLRAGAARHCGGPGLLGDRSGRGRGGDPVHQAAVAVLEALGSPARRRCSRWA